MSQGAPQMGRLSGQLEHRLAWTRWLWSSLLRACFCRAARAEVEPNAMVWGVLHRVILMGWVESRQVQSRVF